MKVIGITGGIASGKTLVSNFIKSKNYTVIEADRIAHDLLEKPKIVSKIAETFGEEVIVNGKVDRDALGKIIYYDKKLQKKLNAIIHPKVRKAINKELKKHRDEDLVFVDVPLLYEAKMEDMMDKIVVVYVERQTQIERLMDRDKIIWDYAVTKIDSQIPLKEKFQRADFIINNEGTKQSTEEQVENFLRELKHEI
ncbi:MAG TPA: dephospho-CoA kinase [Acholeplasmataceae bacterium]|jgi:dephospho-CoA kinase|nr:dephospho-CoA kinase [Acholeplasmataceae bacterium]